MIIEYKVRIGLEVHVPVNSVETKLFCSCRNAYRYKPNKPNDYICPICLGLPGSLPRPNREVLIRAIRAAKALNCRLSDTIQFYRKHYFYPDLPKGYQITQYEAGGYYPLGVDGYLELDNGKKIRIRRVHIEEDPARLVHPSGLGESRRVLVDYNRSGCPLIEIVTEPDIESPDEAKNFLEKLRGILEDVGVLDSSIEYSLKTDANISMGRGARVEIKNVGSAKDVEKALSFEIIRMKRYLDEGVEVSRETRHWDERRKVTVSIREKELEEEYRYFPDPNIPSIDLRGLIDEALATMPPLFDDIVKELTMVYMIKPDYASIIARDKTLYNLFRMVSHEPRDILSNQLICKILVNEGKYLLNRGLVKPDEFAQLLKGVVQMVREGILSEGEARKRLLKRFEEQGYLREATEEVIMKYIGEVLSETELSVDSIRVRDYVAGLVIKRLEEDGYKVDPREVIDKINRVIHVEDLKKTVVEASVSKYLRPRTYRESMVDRVISVGDALSKGEGEAILSGWLESKMHVGGKLFIILRDWTGRIQCVAEKGDSFFDRIRQLHREAFIIVGGLLRRDKRAPSGIELRIRWFEHIGGYEPPPLTLLDLARSGIDVRIKYRYLDLRSMKNRSIMSFRAKLIKTIRNYFYENGFTEINTPKIITTAAEGGAELFPLLFYGREAFLAQSPQLYKQMALNMFQKVFEIDSYYRAQKFDTPRHLAEFWSIDVEASLFNLDDLLALIEDMMIYCIDYLRDEARSELEVLGRELPKLSKPIPRITYVEALKLLRDRGVEIEFGEDLGAEELRLLDVFGDKPYFITFWPRDIRAFYYRINEDDDRLTNSFDFMWPLKWGYPLELASGGERINDPEMLVENMRRKGLFPEAYEWYINMFRYGMPPHAGFGLGLDRLVMALLQLDSILETVFSPRTPKYREP